MPHRIYTTPGFVIESRPHREAGKTLIIFTRELGMVNVAAQGVRLVQSKLRYHTQDFSLAEFSLVRGRDFWRLVGATGIDEATTTRKNQLSPLFVRVLSVIRRFIQGEEKNELLFEAILSAYQFLSQDLKKDSKDADEKLYAENMAKVEPIIMLRILHILGYISVRANLALFLVDNLFSPELIEKMSQTVKLSAVTEINRALKESHL